MTRPTREVRPVAPSPRASGTPRAQLISGIPFAAVLALVGLVVVALATLALDTGNLPFLPNSLSNGGRGQGGGAAGVAKTPTPSNVVVVSSNVPQGITVPGTIVYAKAGNIWLQAGGQASQLTSGGTDSMPSFTPDGKSVLFIRTRYVRGLWNNGTGTMSYYAMDVPSVMQVPITGGTPKRILDGNYNPPGRGQWMAWIREPVLSPDGHTLAVLTDLPNPTVGDVVLKLYDTRTGKITAPNVPEVPPLGHQDPAWRPDGKVLAYVYNNRDGANGVPQIYAYTVATGRAQPISGPGYLHPSWSPDGKYIAVTKTSAYGTDIAILNASTGAEVSLLTDDGSSWGPAWSPAGHQIVFLHSSGQIVDLRLVTLTGPYGDWKAGDTTDLTQAAGLDSVSRPDWFIPADQIPAPTSPPSTPTPPAGTSAPSPS